MAESMFRTLDEREEREFREYAKTTDPPDLSSWVCYHPVCREEWTKRGITPDCLGASI